jgi:hypothetical protein
VGSDELTDFSVADVDIASSSIRSFHVDNHTLNDEDIGQAEYINFVAHIPSTQAQHCSQALITGLDVQWKDHLLMTPAGYGGAFLFSAGFDTTNGQVILKSCNISLSTAGDSNQAFNLLVIDAG